MLAAVEPVDHPLDLAKFDAELYSLLTKNQIVAMVAIAVLSHHT